MTEETRGSLLEEYTARMKNIMEGKGNDYANQDVLSNFKVTADITGTKAELIALTMIAVKVARLGVLLNSDKEPNNESIADSIIDLTNYSFLLHCIMSEEEHK